NPQAGAMKDYLESEVTLPVVPPPLPDEAKPGQWDRNAVAKAVNQANLRLLLAASGINGLFTYSPDVPMRATPVTADMWQKVDGVRVVTDAHKRLVIADDGSRNGSGGPISYWHEAFVRWRRLLAHAWFQPYVRTCIAELE